MKVLILSCNTGQGHNTTSRAIIEEFRHRGVTCEMRDALAFGSERTSKMICTIHSEGAKHLPRTYGFCVNTAKWLETVTTKRSVCYLANMTYAKRLYEFIGENGFDTILAPHVFPSEALTRIRRHIAPGATFRSYFIGTDYSYPPFLHETEMDGYFIPHPDLVPDFISEGLPAEKVFASGIPVPPAFTCRVGKDEAREKLGLGANDHVLMVMTGSIGYGKTGELVRKLLCYLEEDDKVLVFGGNNEKLKEELRSEFSADARLSVLDFTREVSLYMDAADLLLTKPGGLSLTEAAVKGIPMILTSPIPGWEEDNIRFFAAHGFAESGNNADELVTRALALLENPQKREEMVRRQQENICSCAARDICDRVMAEALEG